MRPHLLIPLTVLALAACQIDASGATDEADRPDARAVARLTCPEQSGELLRVGVAPDGRSCNYTAPNGGEVTLRLVALGEGGVSTAMAPIEAQLRQTVPPPDPRPVVRPPATPGGQNDVSINLPFFEVEAGDDGARVRMPGVSVDAQGQDATVNVGGPGGETVRVNSRDGVSEVRVSTPDRRDVRATYILSTEQPTPAGWRLAGYQARGPRGGPLVVATARSRAESEVLFDELDDLIDRNFEARGEAVAARAEAVAERVEARAEEAAARAEARADEIAARAEQAADRAAAAAERAAEAAERAAR